MQQQAGPGPQPWDEGLALRERKRLRTKQQIQAEALELFAAKGYEQTTIDDIAHAAAMSPRTFFRYFPTKEDVVLWDEYDERPPQAIWAGIDGPDSLAELVAIVRRMLADIYAKDPDLLLARVRLSFGVPEIRAQFLDRQIGMIGPHFQGLAEAMGVDPEGLGFRVQLAAIFAAMMIAVERWQHRDGRDDLMALFDQSVAALAQGAAGLAAPGPAAGA